MFNMMRRYYRIHFAFASNLWRHHGKRSIVAAMATLRFHRPAAWMPDLGQWLAFLALAMVTGFWLMRLLAPSPLPLPLSATPVEAEATPQGWHNLFSEKNLGPILLRGVVVGSPSESVAVLSINGGPGRAYRVGSEIASGLRLVAVDRHSATLQRNGTQETLPLSARASAKIAPLSSR